MDNDKDIIGDLYRSHIKVIFCNISKLYMIPNRMISLKKNA